MVLKKIIAKKILGLRTMDKIDIELYTSIIQMEAIKWWVKYNSKNPSRTYANINKARLRELDERIEGVKEAFLYTYFGGKK